MARWVKNPAAAAWIALEVQFNPDPAQWVKGIPCCSRVLSCSSHLIPRLAWKLPCATGAAIKTNKKPIVSMSNIKKYLIIGQA